MKTALLTYTGMENGKIRTVFSAILHFKKPAHRSVAPEYALAIATNSTRMRAIFPRLLPSPPNLLGPCFTLLSSGKSEFKDSFFIFLMRRFG